VCAYPGCGKEFITRRKQQQYHSQECRLADYHETHIRVPVEEYEEFLKWKNSLLPGKGK